VGQSARGEILSRQGGAGAAANLASVGLNANLAPVVDVYRHPGNFIDQFERSYSSSPTRVAMLSQGFIEALQAGGVVATAKHFPGLGAAARGQDTDEGVVRLDVPLSELRAVDEAPYRPAIAAGVRLVMLSWAVYPTLDPDLPAGLSPTVIEGELRHRLGFRGVTITDSLGAGALSAFGGSAQRAVLAARAGDDLLLCSASTVEQDSPTIGIAALRGVASAIASGAIRRATAEQAAERVLRLRLHP
jgi:beta-N-acetylhexosaminidase